MAGTGRAKRTTEKTNVEKAELNKNCRRYCYFSCGNVRLCNNDLPS